MKYSSWLITSYAKGGYDGVDLPSQLSSEDHYFLYLEDDFHL